MKQSIFEAIDRRNTYAVKLEEAKKKFGTDELLPLWVADMDIASPPCVIEAIKRRAAHPLYGYTVYPNRYYEAIIQWYEKRYGWKIQKEWILPSFGVVSSINMVLEAYTQKGDGVLIQTPLYPPFAASIHKHARKVLDNTLVYEDDRYRINFTDFETKAKEAKLFMLCSPHNPTGRVWDRDELERMIDICLENDVMIVSDEIHADIVYEKVHHTLGLFEKIQNKCIVLNAPSKTFNIAGLNTSYTIIPNKKLRLAYMQQQAKAGLENGNPFGIEALIAAYEEGEGWLEELKRILKSNITFVKHFLEHHQLPVRTVETEATFLIWLDCKLMLLNHEDVVKFFSQNARLGLNDGMSFGKAGEKMMRLNIGTSQAVVIQAMQQLLEAFEERE